MVDLLFQTTVRNRCILYMYDKDISRTVTGSKNSFDNIEPIKRKKLKLTNERTREDKTKPEMNGFRKGAVKW